MSKNIKSNIISFNNTKINRCNIQEEREYLALFYKSVNKLTYYKIKIIKNIDNIVYFKHRLSDGVWSSPKVCDYNLITRSLSKNLVELYIFYDRYVNKDIILDKRLKIDFEELLKNKAYLLI